MLKKVVTEDWLKSIGKEKIQALRILLLHSLILVYAYFQQMVKAKLYGLTPLYFVTTCLLITDQDVFKNGVKLLIIF